MKTEAFSAAQYPCPKCDQINTMKGSLEHPEQGYSGYCSGCKTYWKFADITRELTRKMGFEAAFASVNCLVIEFTCDNCAEVNVILPVSVKEEKKSLPECQKPDNFQNTHPDIESAASHLDSHYGGWIVITQTPMYENGENMPTKGVCRFCKAEQELTYPLPEFAKD
jgi:hypothetical protein